MRKTEWAKSGNGPDMLDISIAMKAIETMHEVELNLLIQPDGVLGESGVLVTAVAKKAKLGPGEVHGSVSRKRRYPSEDAKSFEGLLLRLIYEIDHDCTSFWYQTRVPDA